MNDEAREKRQAQVRDAVIACAQAAGVLVRCEPPRRTSDLVMVFLRGPRAEVLGLPLRIFDVLEEYDIEIIRSSQVEGRYQLVLAVTEALDRQRPRLPERRAKLRRRLEREGSESSS